MKEQFKELGDLLKQAENIAKKNKKVANELISKLSEKDKPFFTNLLNRAKSGNISAEEILKKVQDYG